MAVKVQFCVFLFSLKPKIIFICHLCHYFRNTLLVLIGFENAISFGHFYSLHMLPKLERHFEKIRFPSFFFMEGNLNFEFPLIIF